MNKGYAIGFLLVLAVALLGVYVAATGFISTREALRVRPTAVVDVDVGQVTRLPTRIAPAPTVTPTIQLLPTLIPAVTDTAVPAEAGPAEPPAEAPPPDVPIEPSATPPPAAPQPTPTPFTAFQFRLASPPVPSQGGGAYLLGVVRDAQGNPLEGVSVRAWTQWTSATAVSKGGVDLGKYDIPIGLDKVTWYLAVVDAAGQVISSQAVVQFDPAVANQYQVDWQRTF